MALLIRSLQVQARSSLGIVFRAMSTTTKHNFFIYAPYKTDEGAFARRLAVRPAHLERAKGLRESGIIKVGGGLLTPESIIGADAEKTFVGSSLICEAENLEEIRKIIESDVYYTSGVWDPEKLVIVPFLSAFPLP